MSKNSRRIAALAAAGALTLALGACSSSSEDGGGSADVTYAAALCTDASGATPAPVDGPAGEELAGVSASLDGDGVPTIVTAAPSTPATELGSIDLITGAGAEVQAGAAITFNYCGVGQQSQTVFDSSWSRGEPLSYPLTQLIAGWQEGIPGMKEGGVRLLVIPGELAYGETPPAGIGVNETLAFVVEVISVDG